MVGCTGGGGAADVQWFTEKYCSSASPCMVLVHLSSRPCKRMKDQKIVRWIYVRNQRQSCRSNYPVLSSSYTIHRGRRRHSPYLSLSGVRQLGEDATRRVHRVKPPAPEGEKAKERQPQEGPRDRPGGDAELRHGQA